MFRAAVIFIVMSAAERILLIVNPRSGGDRAVRLLPQIEAVIKDLGFKPEIRITAEAGEATTIARLAAAAGYQKIVAVGGDGTVNEVASGIVGSDSIMGVIPAGAGNGFYRSLMTANDLESQCRILVGNRIRRLDAGALNGRMFFNSLGLGFDALIARHNGSRSDKKRRSGKAFFSALKHLRPFKVDLRFDNYRKSGSLSSLTVNIGSVSGNGMSLAPSARPDDGKFDICVVTNAGYLHLMRLVWHAGRKSNGMFRMINMFRCRKFEIACDQFLPVHIDGEPLEDRNRLSISIAAAVLPVAVDRDDKRSS